jgi:hypothetical protein
MIEYYSRDGSPMSRDEWAAAMASDFDDTRRVAKDTVGDVEVSTVWLGLNHQYGDGPPLIFETMVFGGELDGEQWRDATEAEAYETHKHAVGLVRESVGK